MMFLQSVGFCSTHQISGLGFLFHMTFLYKAHNNINKSFMQVTLILPSIVEYQESPVITNSNY
jgi:hypothetical protein